MAKNVTLVFVHGWSVTNLNTYGQLPVRLREQGKQAGINIIVKDIYLGQYISFHDEVKVQDISRAFNSAIKETLVDLVKNKERFVAITHSTGGPVVRDWSERYKAEWPTLPMSHLIMLAPANFGSTLAQLGKSKVSRLKSWFEGVEPGQGVLDWLELGSNESWNLNMGWINKDAATISESSFFPFVLIGQAIDRNFYDNLNSYTGEMGSDGVVRCSGANLNASYISITQPAPGSNDAVKVETKVAPRTAFRIVENSSHSGTKMGILAGEKAAVNDPTGNDTVNAILNCIKVGTKSQYDALCDTFVAETAQVQQKELIEPIKKGIFSLKDRYFFHDRFSMVTFKLVDSEGYPVRDFDLLFTTGPNNNPNLLPEGFFVDRQRNSKNGETITYYINYDIMNSSPAVINDKKEEIRAKNVGIDNLGLTIVPRPADGFVHYAPFTLNADNDFFDKVITPNATTLIEIRLQRLVDKNVFLLKGPITEMPTSKTKFSDIKTSGENVK